MFKHASDLVVETRYSWVFNTGYLISFMQMAAVLKKDHSLKGKNPYRLIKLIRDWDRTDPAVLARIRKDHPLTDYNTADLLGHLEGIVGTPANELFEMASVEGADRPAYLPRGYVLFALHCAVLILSRSATTALWLPC